MLIVILFPLFNLVSFSHQFKIFVVEVGQSVWELVEMVFTVMVLCLVVKALDS